MTESGSAGTPGGEETGGLPYGVTSYYASLALSRDPERDPIAAQFIPRAAERRVLPCETTDPLSDDAFRVSPRVVHHYRDRVLVLAHDRCATYCRHCFRRHFTARGDGGITEQEVRDAAAYLGEHREVHEALVSGGDPLMLSDDRLRRLLESLRDARPDLILRVATRMPVVQPRRVTAALAGIFGGLAPLWAVIQANHPRELTAEFAGAVDRLVEAGVPVLNQSVLLRGVNDDADTLEELCRGLLRTRVKPYYLFQGDLAAGTSHLRTTIDEGLALMRELRQRLSGMAVPVYALDLPGGGGKVPLAEATIVRREPGWYVLRDDEGREYRYPDAGAPTAGP